jgi:hypothetical protein
MDILNKNFRLSSESPVASYLSVVANLSLAGIACRKEVFFREMIRHGIFSRSSESVVVMQVTFLKPL